MDSLDRIAQIRDSHLEKANAITTLQLGLSWFSKNFGHLDFTHRDLRGGNVNPVLILAVDSLVEIKNDLKANFESDESYHLFKKYLLSIGFHSSRDNKTYFYIQCNSELNDGEYDNSEIKKTMKNRCNKELFEHIDNYFIEETV